MYKYEKKLASNGYKLIAGIDEVGRGCIAGPLVCAIVILPIGYKNSQIKDSKLLSAKKRDILDKQIKKDAIAYHIEMIDPIIVDQLNPKQASRLGMKLCVEKIKIRPDFLLIDFEKIDSKIEQLSITKGDQNSISIAAASIIAKVYRDSYMTNLNDKYPKYNFSANKGYLTKNHILALSKYGPLKDIHRFSYKPIKK